MLKLDQFYTKPEIARHCWRKAAKVFAKLSGDGLFYIEPSAGDGAFFDLLPAARRAGFDIDPRPRPRPRYGDGDDEVKKADFLRCQYTPPAARQKTVVLGNPPFGKRGKMAVDFVNKAFTMADTVAFIVPVIFRKHFIHKQIDKDAKLVASFALPRDSFRIVAASGAHSDYSVNTEFQIWTKAETRMTNRRLFTPPPISHPDFEMYQYNNTRQALKMFCNAFDFAVPCQGFQDYARRETNADDCEKHKQWMLFKAHSDKARRILDKRIDYQALSLKNITAIPGFRKGDVVAEYARVS